MEHMLPLLTSVCPRKRYGQVLSQWDRKYTPDTVNHGKGGEKRKNTKQII